MQTMGKEGAKFLLYIGMLNKFLSRVFGTFAVTALVFNILSAAPVLAIGQITTPIVQENLLAGQKFQEEIMAYNSEPSPAVFVLSTNGDVAGWGVFYAPDDKKLVTPISEMTVPAQAYGRAEAVFTIPDGTPNGTYKGGAVVSAKPTGEAAGQKGVSTSVQQQVTRQVTITVTGNQQVAFGVQVIPVDYDVAPGDTLKIRFIYENTGNVNVKPDVRLKISKDGKVVQNAIYSFPESEEAVKVRTRRDLSYLVWSTSGQPDGRYRAELEFLVDGKVYATGNFNFNVGTVVSSGLLALSNGLGGSALGIGLIVLAIVLLALSILARLKKQSLLKFSLKQFSRLATRIKSLF